MNTNPNKAKLIILSAILIVVVLFVSIIATLVGVYQNDQKLAKQQAEIEKMENQKKYYDYIAGKDDSLIEYEVEIPGENKW